MTAIKAGFAAKCINICVDLRLNIQAIEYKPRLKPGSRPHIQQVVLAWAKAGPPKDTQLNADKTTVFSTEFIS